MADPDLLNLKRNGDELFNHRPHKKQAHLPNGKSFKLHGRIAPDEAINYYCIDMKSSNQFILNLLEKSQRRYLMMRAPSGAGKTTRLLTLMEQLRGIGYECFYISLAYLSPNCDSTQFWKEFSHALSVNTATFSSKLEFIQWFATENKEAFGSKNVVLLVDDFQQLYNWQEANREELLGALGILQSMCGVTCLSHCIVAGQLGVEMVLQKVPSPFSPSDAIAAPNFTQEEVIELFSQFAKDRQLQWDDRISADIHHRTSGFPALVCFCGKQAMAMVEKSSPFTYEKWLHFTFKELSLSLCAEYTTMATAIERCLQADLTTQFLIKLSQRSEPTVLPEWLPTIRLLSGAGVLIQEGLECVFTSPITRNLVADMISRQHACKFPNKAFPFDSQGKLKAASIAFELMEHFHNKKISLAVYQPAAGYQTPPQALYHFECLAILRQWAAACDAIVCSDTCSIRKGDNEPCQATVPEEQYSILLITHRASLLIRIVADESNQSIESHLSQVRWLANAIGVTQSAVFHFYVADKTKDIPPLEDVIHIRHGKGTYISSLGITTISPAMPQFF